MSFVYYILLFMFLSLSILLSLVILMQESKGTGLGASFGSDASSSMFGTSTASVLKKFTAYMAIIFMGSCIILSIWTAALVRTSTRSIPEVMEEVQK